MLLLRYLLLLTGWGLLVATAANVFRNLYQVVQYHRQLRPIAPGSLSGISSGPEGASMGTPSTHGALVEKPQLNWATAKWAFPAAWLPLILAAGIVVVPSGMGGIRVSQTAGTRPLWQELANLGQAKSNYGAIVYNKAPAVLKQLEFLVGPGAFQAGVQRFLARHAYGNATWQDLLGSIGRSARRPLTRFGQDFMLRPGMPVVEQQLAVRNGRIAAAACIFPVSQRETLDRSLGLRHRAGLGITEESDAIAVVVSEETGGISICHRRRIERNFTPETFRKRIGEILLQGTYEDEETDPEQLAREVDLPPARDNPLVPHQKERSNDTLAV